MEWERGREGLWGGWEGRVDGREGNLRRRQETEKKRTECVCVNVHPSVSVCARACRVRRARAPKGDFRWMQTGEAVTSFVA